MPGTYTKPKAYNRRFFIDFGSETTPDWAEVAVGVTSRGSSFSEKEDEYFYMDGRGTAEKEASSQSVSRTFAGNRVIGDKAQDEIFITRLYDLDNRQVRFTEFYDNAPTGPNGWQGMGTLTITDDGSGDTPSRENIGFSLAINGKPKRGAVTVTDGVPEFVPEV